jgi:hypothetical protein
MNFADASDLSLLLEQNTRHKFDTGDRQQKVVSLDRK